jgi:RsiW-degrading membrane proteinase PrsW (M82 family)
MTPAYRKALGMGALGIGAVLWALLGTGEPPALALLLAAAAAPIAVLLVVWGRLGGSFPRRALLGGALVGPLVALASHAFVAAFADAFLVGFADSGRRLLDSLRADPRITDVLGSPWVLLLLIELCAVAPLTEELGKALGASISRPKGRREAFLSGVAAGVGFAVIENVLYAVAGASLGGPWPAIVLARALGAAVHPLACGLVMLGWWEWRKDRNLLALLRRYLTGVGIHALWNGSLVALFVVESAYDPSGSLSGLGPAALAYSGAIGVVLLGVLWMVTSAVANERDPFSALALKDSRTVAGWALLSASLLLPVGILILAFPDFYRG